MEMKIAVARILIIILSIRNYYNHEVHEEHEVLLFVADYSELLEWQARLKNVLEQIIGSSLNLLVVASHAIVINISPFNLGIFLW